LDDNDNDNDDDDVLSCCLFIVCIMSVCLSVGHTVMNGDQIYPAVQPYANFGQYETFSSITHTGRCFVSMFVLVSCRC